MVVKRRIKEKQRRTALRELYGEVYSVSLPFLFSILLHAREHSGLHDGPKPFVPHFNVNDDTQTHTLSLLVKILHLLTDVATPLFYCSCIGQ